MRVLFQTFCSLLQVQFEGGYNSRAGSNNDFTVLIVFLWMQKAADQKGVTLGFITGGTIMGNLSLLFTMCIHF